MAEIPRNPGEHEQAERDKAIARIQDFLKIDAKDVSSTITDEHRETLEEHKAPEDTPNCLLAVQMLGLSDAVSALIPYDGRRIVMAQQSTETEGRSVEANFWCGRPPDGYGVWKMSLIYDAGLIDSKGWPKEARRSAVLPGDGDLRKFMRYRSMLSHVTQALCARESDLRFSGPDEWYEKKLEILPNGGRARREYNGDRLHNLKLKEEERNACYRVDLIEHAPFYHTAGSRRDLGIEGYVTITQEMLARFLDTLNI